MYLSENGFPSGFVSNLRVYNLREMSEKSRELLQTNHVGGGETNSGRTLITGVGAIFRDKQFHVSIDRIERFFPNFGKQGLIPKQSVKTELTFTIAANLVIHAVCFQQIQHF